MVLSEPWQQVIVFNVSFFHTSPYPVLLTSGFLPERQLFFLIVLCPYLFLSKFILQYPKALVKLAAWRLQLEASFLYPLALSQRQWLINIFRLCDPGCLLINFIL